jgi:signal transduction histidine kinase
MGPVKLYGPFGAVLVAALSVVVALLGMAVWWGGPRDGGDWAWTLAAALLYGPAGAAMISRAPRLGVTFLVISASSGVALLAGEQAEAVAAGRSGYAGGASVWLSSWTWVPAYVLLIAVLPHLLPDGRPPSGWLRWGYHVGVAAAVVSTAAWLLAPYDELDEASAAAVALDATNPVGIPGTSVFIALGLILALTGGLSGILSLGVRWYSARDRRQLAWVLAGVGGTAVVLASSLAVPGGSSTLLALAVIPLPAAVVLGAASSTARLDSQLRLSEARLAIAHEEERRRLRHDLHDSLGPALAGVALQLEALSTDIESDPVRAAEVASRLTDRVRDAVAEVRRLVEGLGPDGTLGLAEALRTQVESFDAPVLRSTLQLNPDDVRDLPAAVEVVAVRVVSEALANAARHAAGDRCSVTVSRDDQQLLVQVRDNGIGISASRATGLRNGSGVGLLSMQAVAQQIGGSCTVTDAVGGGTEVRLALPLVPA